MTESLSEKPNFRYILRQLGLTDLAEIFLVISRFNPIQNQLEKQKSIHPSELYI